MKVRKRYYDVGDGTVSEVSELKKTYLEDGESKEWVEAIVANLENGLPMSTRFAQLTPVFTKSDLSDPLLERLSEKGSKVKAWFKLYSHHEHCIAREGVIKHKGGWYVFDWGAETSNIQFVVGIEVLEQ